MDCEKYNSIQLKINLMAATDVFFKCKKFTGKISVKIVKNSIADIDGYLFIANGADGAELKVFFQWLHIEGLSGFHQEE